MNSLDIAAFSDLKQLSQAFARTGSLKSLSDVPGMPPIAKNIVLLGPAAVAEWISRFAPELKEKHALKIALISPQEDGLEAVDKGRWYSLLADMLGRPGMDVSVSIVAMEPDTGSREVPPGLGPAARHYALPFHAYLENRPDGPIDVIFLHDIDLLIPIARDWVDELQRLAESGTRVAGIAAHQDEFELQSGLLDLYGFKVKGSPSENRFGSRPAGGVALRPWAQVIWEVDCAGRTPFELGENTGLELRTLYHYLDANAKRGEGYPPMSTLGRLVSGADSPASNGCALICLPESIWFDPATERLFKQTESGLVSLKEMDDFGRKSALLASYDGRTSRIEQIMWAVHVFKDFIEHIQDAGLGEEEDGATASEDEDIGSHSATERVDAVKDYLADVLEDESPKTKLRAALQLALHIVEHEGGLGTRSDDAEDGGG
jgi:hypothetical protein